MPLALHFVDMSWRKSFALWNLDANVQDLYCNLLTPKGVEAVIVSKTPHFQLSYAYLHNHDLEKAKSEYINYTERFFPLLEAKPRMAKFLHLCDSIKNDKKLQESIYVRMNFRGQFVIVDGLHRSAVLNSLGVTKIKSKILII